MNLNYGFGDNQVKQNVAVFPVAPNVDNVEITKCEYISGTAAATGKEWEAIDITYSRGEASISDRIFAINPDNVYVRSFIPDDTHEAALEDKVKNFNTQLKHIATKVDITDEQLATCNMSNFKTMATDYCNLIMSKCKGVKLYLKTTKDGGYTKVCRNANNTTPFLQKMVSGVACDLAYTDREFSKLQDEMAPKNGVMSNGAPAASWMPSDSV